MKHGRFPPVTRNVMDSYKTALYTGHFQEQNFLRRPGLGFIRLVMAMIRRL
jgi:hypothetical protein